MPAAGLAARSHDVGSTEAGRLPPAVVFCRFVRSIQRPCCRFGRSPRTMLARRRKSTNMRPVELATDVISFGPFSLSVGQRLLTRHGAPVELGARALDVLIALISRPNQVIGKKQLLAEIWPDLTVERGQPALPYRQPAQGAGRRQGRCAIHHDGIGTRLLLRRPGRPARATDRRRNAGQCGDPVGNQPARPPLTRMSAGPTGLRRCRRELAGSAARHHRRPRRSRQDDARRRRRP